MQQFANAGYDRALTVFSPDGRLFQIEYAREAVKRGTTSIGIVSKDGVILAVDKKIKSKLIVPSSIEKIFKIDEHIATASSGLVADARRLIDIARNQAQINKLNYHEPISTTGLAKYIGDLEQTYTQRGIRPFGVSLIIGGVSDDECQIYETDPSGALVEYKATAIGLGREKALELFEEKYSNDISLEDAIDLAIEGIFVATDGKLADDSVEISIIDKETSKYRKVDETEIDEYVQKVIERKEQEKIEAEEKAKKEAEEKEAKKAEAKAKKEAEKKAKEENEEIKENSSEDVDE
ncbi:archaeal proteasome endopeptidase complex subunit alpha [Methanosphaera sp. WGK6]|uniref:archaeal proteasome endopeptidase complex subunit alpha n=1 Tax=Methanosphaera sp. WGK6 TaxID=1561964 RepID=UPI00084CE4ED|nr:archaeal proteasome endopeptidase complex subunit alpha [Methanosphaera sp. WGK6]OED30683.1 proteasome subunit alpha [Methanosphaera sp. WGK6]